MQLPSGLVNLALTNLHLALSPHTFTAPQHTAHLAGLAGLHLEHCHLRTCQLGALTSKLGLLTSLALIQVAGLTSDGVALLHPLTNLRSLKVVAAHNNHVSQAALCALSKLTGLRHLHWHTDDLTSRGPRLECYTPFTALRALSLSCSERTCARALGSPEVLSAFLPYCSISCVRSSGYDGPSE